MRLLRRLIAYWRSWQDPEALDVPDALDAAFKTIADLTDQVDHLRAERLAPCAKCGYHVEVH